MSTKKDAVVLGALWKEVYQGAERWTKIPIRSAKVEPETSFVRIMVVVSIMPPDFTGNPGLVSTAITS